MAVEEVKVFLCKSKTCKAKIHVCWPEGETETTVSCPSCRHDKWTPHAYRETGAKKSRGPDQPPSVLVEIEAEGQITTHGWRGVLKLGEEIETFKRNEETKVRVG